LPHHTLSKAFNKFFDSEKSSGVLLVFCTALSLAIANSSLGPAYLRVWQSQLGDLSLEHWINDGLMALFFLVIGLELERELYSGELANLKNAILPIFAAIGGMVVPAILYFSMTAGTPAQAGIGIPMATDIAFALGVLALLSDRIPASLRVFVVVFAVIDDLGAIILIACFYTTHLSIWYLAGALAVWTGLGALNRLRVTALAPYLVGGGLLWFLMLKSGVHATLAGVMLAFAVPFSAKNQASPSHKLEHLLHRPVAFIVLPVFALANTGVVVGADWLDNLTSANSLGIALGLLVGKPAGLTLFCFMAVAMGLCRLPEDLKWRHVLGAGILGGIGFTMSIFITNLAFAGDMATINTTKIAILLASMAAGIVGFLWLQRAGDRNFPNTRQGIDIAHGKAPGQEEGTGDAR
jgi:Na+:H+ antiporter, NhaA family